jgi:hypothetical protein
MNYLLFCIFLFGTIIGIEKIKEIYVYVYAANWASNIWEMENHAAHNL